MTAKFWLIALLWIPLSAHDFWIQPKTFSPQSAGVLPVQTLVGEHFEGEAIVPASRLVKSFLIHDQTGGVELRPGMAGLAGIAMTRRTGLAMIAYTGFPSLLTLKGAKFDRYLAEERLTNVITQRRGADPEAMVREHFSRCAKALVCVGAAGDDPDYGRRLGHRLELVPRENPLVGSAESGLVFQLYYEGKPLAGAPVTALHRGDQVTTWQALTDETGLVRFTDAPAGVWLIKTIHMLPSDGDDVDYESIWASLTFERRALP